MAEAITVQTIIDEVNTRTDYADSDFITDAELLNYINSSWKQLYNKIVEINANYYITSNTFTVSGGTSLYNLPNDFYKMQGVDAKISGSDTLSLEPFNFNDRNRYNNFVADPYFTNYSYIIRGDEIELLPAGFTGEVTLWYTPRPADLTATTDTVNTIQGYYSWIIEDVCMKVMAKAQQDFSVFSGNRNAIEADMGRSLSQRDANMPKKMTVKGRMNSPYRRRFY